MSDSVYANDVVNQRNENVDVAVIGLPGPLLQWTADFLEAALQIRYGIIERVSISDHTAPLPDRSGNSPSRLLVGTFIDAHWRPSLMTSHMILVMEDVASALAWIVGTGQQFGEGVRSLVMIATSLGDIAGRDDTLTITNVDFTCKNLLGQRLLHHIGLHQHQSDTITALSKCSIWPASTVEHAASESVLSQLKAVIAPAVHYASTGTRVPITWTRDCLFHGDQPGQALPRVLDLTGRARIVAYGPYYHVPAGRWRMQAFLAISPSACGRLFSLGLYGATELGSFEFQPEQPGFFVASMSVYIRSSLERVECRLAICRGAIDGSIGLDRIEFRPE